MTAITKKHPLKTILPLAAVATLTICALPIKAATIVDVDATALGLTDGDAIASIANSGSAGQFSTVTGSVTAASHPANNAPGVMIQGLGFNNGAARMNSAVTAESVGLSGNASYSITSWVWNPAIANEEAIVAWGNRGGPDGTNAGFHQGVHAGFGAVGHWGGGPDVGWGNAGADINATIGQWSHLSVTFDGNETRLFIDGVFNNSEITGVLNVHGGANVISIGSESDAGNLTNTPIPFSGTIAQVQVFDTVLSDQDILNDFNADSLLFFDGVTNEDDTDGDGILDSIEDRHVCLDKNVADADEDPDLDGLSNAEELLLGTDPCNADSDGDNISDGDEVNRMAGGLPAPTDPLNADTDGDGLADDVETDTGMNNGASDTGTDPLSADSDADGWDDGLELALGTDPNDDQDFPVSVAIVDVDATALELTDGDAIGSIDNPGPAGLFTTVTGSVTAASHPANNNAGVMIQGLGFNNGAARMNSAVTAESVRLSGNASYSITSWVWNPEIANEEAIVAWGNRGGPDGTNAGFHQGIHAGFGAIGHWGGGPDVGWGNGGTDINATIGQWSHLSTTFDGNEQRLFIDGVFNNSEIIGAINVHGGTNVISIGSESDNGSTTATPIPFSGTIAQVQVWDIVMSDQDILNDFNADKALFFDGVSPGSGDTLNLKVVSVGDDLVFTWKSQPGKLYNLRTDLDLEPGDPEQWSILGLHQDIVATPPLNTLTIPRPADPERYFAIEEFPAPPVFAFFDDLENGIGDWAIGSDGDPGSEWELGVPNFVGPPAAFSGTNCFGTIIGAVHSASANDWLRSPSIDLTAAAIATLSFRAFRDIDDGFDFGRVAVLDASNGTEIAVLEADITGLSNGWDQVSYPLPAGALGKMIKIEFRFTSDGSVEFPGWYLDDIAVTTP